MYGTARPNWLSLRSYDSYASYDAHDTIIGLVEGKFMTGKPHIFIGKIDGFQLSGFPERPIQWQSSPQTRSASATSRDLQESHGSFTHIYKAFNMAKLTERPDISRHITVLNLSALMISKLSLIVYFLLDELEYVWTTWRLLYLKWFHVSPAWFLDTVVGRKKTHVANPKW